MNDDRVIELLRAAGTGGSDDIGPAMRKGAKIRRRQRIGQVAGGGAGLAAVVAMGIFVTGINSSSTVVVAPPATQASSAPATSTKPLTWPQMEEANVQLLLDTLGAGWGHGRTSSYRSVELDPHSATADGLPEDHVVLASIRVIQAGLLVGTPCNGCEERQLSGGRTVQVAKPQQFRDSLRADHSTSALYNRSDGSRVLVTMTAHDNTKALSAERSEQVIAFLDGYVDTVAELAASEDVRPRVGEQAKSVQAPPTTREINLRYLQEALGDAWGTNVDSENRITLKPESDLARQLPSGDYQGKATLEILSKAQFDAACNGKPHAAECETQTLPDGRTIRWRSWFDRDANSDGEYRFGGTMLGESAVYLERENGTAVMALISVLGRDLALADRDSHEEIVLTWFDSLRDELITAVTDKRVGAEVFTTK